jgi:D-serine dehydratase
MALRLAPVLDMRLAPGTRGLPAGAGNLRVRDIASQGWNVLREDLTFPVAVLKSAALAHNISTMHGYFQRAAMELAPHGKTTMCPQLFERQLDNGAWGITVATISQLQLCHAMGVRRVLLANELVGKAELALFASLCAQAPDHEYLVLIDSAAGATQLAAAMAATRTTARAKVLLEVGMPRGRCGVRDPAACLGLARHIASLPNLELAGIEGYEGLIVTADAGEDVARVNQFLDTVLEIYRAIRAQDLFANPARVIVSAGGSVYYDLFARFARENAANNLVFVARSGCYITCDAAFYQRAQERVSQRAAAGSAPSLIPALEIWARVLSVPEAGLAVVGLGKRDCSHDIDPPLSRWWYSAARMRAPEPLPTLPVLRLNDQHALLDVGETAFEVGDLVGFGISHPCTTFDKWSLLMEVDDDYNVLGGLKTFF